MTLTDFLQPLDLDTHIRMAGADADLIYFGPAGDLPLPGHASSMMSSSAGPSATRPSAASAVSPSSSQKSRRPDTMKFTNAELTARIDF